MFHTKQQMYLALMIVLLPLAFLLITNVIPYDSVLARVGLSTVFIGLIVTLISDKPEE